MTAKGLLISESLYEGTKYGLHADTNIMKVFWRWISFERALWPSSEGIVIPFELIQSALDWLTEEQELMDKHGSHYDEDFEDLLDFLERVVELVNTHGPDVVMAANELSYPILDMDDLELLCEEKFIGRYPHWDEVGKTMIHKQHFKQRELPEWIRPYFDYADWAADNDGEGFIVYQAEDGGLFVFWELT